MELYSPDDNRWELVRWKNREIDWEMKWGIGEGEQHINEHTENRKKEWRNDILST